MKSEDFFPCSNFWGIQSFQRQLISSVCYSTFLVWNFSYLGQTLGLKYKTKELHSRKKAVITDDKFQEHLFVADLPIFHPKLSLVLTLPDKLKIFTYKIWLKCK